jgi:hypothetical protein
MGLGMGMVLLSPEQLQHRGRLAPGRLRRHIIACPGRWVELIGLAGA